MHKIRCTPVIVVLLLILCSCESRKRTQYFNNINELAKTDSISYLQPMLVQPGDILQVTISTINRDITAMYNPSANFVNASPVAQGYLVERDGFIVLPEMGKIYVKGKTTGDISATIKTELEKSVKNPFVSTRISNFKVSVLGDVANPGSFNITNERVSILEALSLAGDANISAKRNEVLLIREREGKKNYVTLDMNDSKVLSSPYYYLSNNDVVYVRPGVNKAISSSATVQLLPLIATGLTLILVLYNNVIK